MKSQSAEEFHANVDKITEELFRIFEDVHQKGLALRQKSHLASTTLEEQVETRRLAELAEALHKALENLGASKKLEEIFEKRIPR